MTPHKVPHVRPIHRGWVLLQDHTHVLLPDISSPVEVADASEGGGESPLLAVQYPPSRPDGAPDADVSRRELSNLTGSAYREVGTCLVAYGIDEAPNTGDAPRHDASRTCWGWLVLVDPRALGEEVSATEEVFGDRVHGRVHLLRELECFTSATMVITTGLRGDLARMAASTGDRRPADLDVRDDDGRRHRLWVVGDPAIHEAVTRAACADHLLVVDGNHRAEAAQAAGLTGLLAFLTDDPGVRMAPMHRALHAPGSGAEEIVEAWRPAVQEAGPRPHGEPTRGRVVVADDDSAWEVVLPDPPEERLGPEYGYVDEVLVEGVLGLDPAVHVTPLQDASHAPRDSDVLLLMPPISGDELEQVAGGARLPRKSAVFGPKPLTGVFLAHTPVRDVEVSESTPRRSGSTRI